MLSNLIFQQNYTKKPPKKGVSFLIFWGFFKVRVQDGSRMGPRPQNHQQITKKHRFSIICSSISALWATDSFSDLLHRIQYVLHCPPHCSTELLAKPRGGTKVLDLLLDLRFCSSWQQTFQAWDGLHTQTVSANSLSRLLGGAAMARRRRLQ